MDAFADATRIDVNHRDEFRPIMTRAHLRTDPEPPRVLVACAFDDEPSALAAADRLRAEPRPGVRVL